jgi:hypothetical protein
MEPAEIPPPLSGERAAEIMAGTARNLTESERRLMFRYVPILGGFLSTLLQDAENRERDETSHTGIPYEAGTIYDCPDSTFNAAADICRQFLAAPGVADMLGENDWSGMWNAAGSDLYLTVAGHGAGFWDGDWPHGDPLTEAAHGVARWLETYVGDDGRVYICGRE